MVEHSLRKESSERVYRCRAYTVQIKRHEASLIQPVFFAIALGILILRTYKVIQMDSPIRPSTFSPLKTLNSCLVCSYLFLSMFCTYIFCAIQDYTDIVLT